MLAFLLGLIGPTQREIMTAYRALRQPSKVSAPQATGTGPDNTDIDLAFQYLASPPDKGQTE